jgi:hypothetical protein
MDAKTDLLEQAARWEVLSKAPTKERGPFTKRFCVFKAEQLRQRADQVVTLSRIVGPYASKRDLYAGSVYAQK